MVTIFAYTDYRLYLRAELAERTRANPAYSLRGMARQLGVQGSQLSKVINGKANFSSEAASRVAQKLRLAENELDYFCTLVQLAADDGPIARERAVGRLNALRPAEPGRAIYDLSVDHHRQISDWYHSAILQLADLRGFELTAESAARELGVSRLQVEVALERLERLGLLSRDARGKWKRIPEDIQLIHTPETSAALKTFFLQMLEKAGDAVEAQPFGQRLSSYQTISMPVSALPEAEKLMDRFTEELLALARSHGGAEHVYHLMVHLFDLTPSLGRRPGKSPRSPQ